MILLLFYDFTQRLVKNISVLKMIIKVLKRITFSLHQDNVFSLFTPKQDKRTFTE